ncbi:hypothetical protein PPERSA_10610 [Pseudocohnilembus persalinus]|uniref:Uncharacterized protein n=1 Tax=Pseudocohnilembus persalinus TaxID=266149 RepID=A0A0V0R0A7_PSEPJ|nr:hypothetical protein PPERSA_10610 [Pseudocohnilembus persalinus]|eukprot:KRX07975.1 hypothetical protein PPERSA_10610 [Pseudocohnilembus persalinus]
MKKINKNYVKNIVNGLLNYVQDQREQIQQYYEKYLSEEDKKCLKIKNFFYKYKSKRFRITNKQDFRKLFITPKCQQQQKQMIIQNSENNESSKNNNKYVNNSSNGQKNQCGYIDIQMIQDENGQNQSSEETCQQMQYIDSKNEINESFTNSVKVNQTKKINLQNKKTNNNKQQNKQQQWNKLSQIQQYNDYMKNFVMNSVCDVSVIKVPIEVLLKNLEKNQQNNQQNIIDQQQLKQLHFQEKIQLKSINKYKCDSLGEFNIEKNNRDFANQKQQKQKAIDRNCFYNYTQQSAVSIQGFKHYLRNKKKQNEYRLIEKENLISQQEQQEQQNQKQKVQMQKMADDFKQEKITGKNRGVEIERKILRVFFRKFVNSDLLTYCIHKSRIRNPQYIIRVKNKVLDCLKSDFIQRKEYYQNINNIMDYEP